MSTSLSSSPLSTSPAAFPDPADRRDALGGDSRGAGADGKDPLWTVRDDARARTLSNETSCTTVDYVKRRRFLVAHNPSSALDVTPDASPLGFLTGAGFGIFLPPRFPSFPWSHSSG